MAKLEQTSKQPFRVVIVGAGLVGLSLSHALQLANIDHVVLEKHDKIVSIHGAALMIYPGVARIFDQFGILEDIHKNITPVQREAQRWPDGSVNLRGKNLGLVSQKFDMPVILFDRQRCVTHLYDGLPDKSKVRTSARVDRIEHTSTGVKVYLTDGTFEQGDIVIGADGVHSRVRQLMWDYASKYEPNTIPDSDKQALFSEYKGIFGVSSSKDLPDLGPADVNTIMGHDTTQLVFTQPGIVYWALMFKSTYSQPPLPFRPTQDEQDAVAARYKAVKLGPSLTFEDVYKAKSRSGLLNIEEGILSQWHAGRIVLVGDSAHKMTADIGIGANMAIESAVTLANVLHAHLSAHPNTHPSPSELSALFTQYQSKRFVRAKTFMDISGKVTRMRSWQSMWKRFFVMYIAPMGWMQRAQSKAFIDGFAISPKVEYAPVRTINVHAEGWKRQKKGTPWVSYGVAAVVVVGWAWWVVGRG